jgi:hypothetical protein
MDTYEIKGFDPIDEYNYDRIKKALLEAKDIPMVKEIWKSNIRYVNRFRAWEPLLYRSIEAIYEKATTFLEPQ